jgi:hypothetical protein
MELKDSPNSFYSNYLLTQFFATGSFPDYDGNRTWIVECLKHEQQYPTSMLATNSLARAYFGRRHHQKAVLDDGIRTYSKALLALREDLKDPRKSLSFDVLAATASLTLYEHLMFTTTQGWIQRTQGVARLIEISGPKRFLKYPERAILDMNRQSLIIQALTSRKRTFLEQKRWIEVAWPESNARPQMVILHDIFTRLPGITEDILRTKNDPSFGEGFLLATQQSIDQVVADLRALELDMLMDESYLAGEEHSDPASPGNPFDKRVIYQSIIAANAWTSFDTILIIALEWQYRSRHLDWQKGTKHQGYELIPETRQYALHICQSVEYLLQPQWMHSGAFYLLFPARVAYYALPIESLEAHWLVGILESIAMVSGFEMARNVLTNVQINEEKPDGTYGHAVQVSTVATPARVP